MVSAKRVLTLTGLAALGPISGPLVAGILRNLRKRQLMLASLYALALPMAWYELAILADWASRVLIR
jgi:hypothetical protein